MPHARWSHPVCGFEILLGSACRSRTGCADSPSSPPTPPHARYRTSRPYRVAHVRQPQRRSAPSSRGRPAPAHTPTEGGDLDYGRRDVRWQRRRGLEELFHPYNIAGALPVVVRAAHRRLNERLLGPGQSSRCLFRAPPEICNVGFVHESSTLFGPHFTCPSHHAAPRRDLAAPLLDQAGTSGRSWPWPR